MERIQGRPDFVEEEAGNASATAQVMDDATNKLYSLGYGEMHSEATDAMQTNVQQLREALLRAHDRYSEFSAALTEYAPVLRDVMQRVDAAIAKYQASDVSNAQHQATIARLNTIKEEANPFSSPASREQARQAEHDAANHAALREQAAREAQHEYDLAMQRLKGAADQAGGRIKRGDVDSGLNDGFWDKAASVVDKIHDALSKALEIIDEILDALSTILAGIAVALLALSVVFPAIAAIAVPLAEIISAVSDGVQALDLAVKVVRFQLGDITFGELMASALLTVAAVLLTPIGGKFTAKLAVKAIGHGDEIFEEAIEKGTEFVVGRVGDHYKPGLGKFIDNIVSVPPEIQIFHELAHHDVDQLHPDFSHINLDDIMQNSGFSSPADSNPVIVDRMYADVGSGSGGGGW
ncbi:MAG TPA: hypothetical protein VHD81_05045 [Mycobacteriales bacterium]|nr:hypothetical protein [Mycobacteriales bacterium]